MNIRKEGSSSGLAFFCFVIELYPTLETEILCRKKSSAEEKCLQAEADKWICDGKGSGRCSQALLCAMQWQIKRQQAKNEIQEILFKHQEKLIYLFIAVRVSHTKTFSLERLWSLHPWRHSQSNGMWPWTSCSNWHCFEQGEVDQINHLLASPL